MFWLWEVYAWIWIWIWKINNFMSFKLAHSYTNIPKKSIRFWDLPGHMHLQQTETNHIFCFICNFDIHIGVRLPYLSIIILTMWNIHYSINFNVIRIKKFIINLLKGRKENHIKSNMTENKSEYILSHGSTKCTQGKLQYVNWNATIQQDCSLLGNQTSQTSLTGPLNYCVKPFAVRECLRIFYKWSVKLQFTNEQSKKLMAYNVFSILEDCSLLKYSKNISTEVA